MKTIPTILILLVCMSAGTCFAGEKLRDDLTVLGAIKAGNSSGTIPEWTGGITQIPERFQKGGFRPDPFSEDKPLFEITSVNWQQYKEQLSLGQQAMFQKFADYRMPIYPTRRSASYPQFIYDAAKKNAGMTQMINDGNSIQGGEVAVPFPVPENGLEVMWNHVLRFRGQQLTRDTDECIVTGKQLHHYNSKEFLLFPISFIGHGFDSKDNMNVYYKQIVEAPPRLAGTLLLVHETLDKVKALRRAWIYNPGLRRVNRAPFVSYDTIPPSSDGLRTYDEYDMFNGAFDRYDWTLEGRHEMYIPYNAYRFASAPVKAVDIAGVHFVKPEFTRYELHRVWKVDAKLKSDKSHLYSRRTFYLDEDTWQIVLVDIYDHRGELWRFSEGHAANFYDVPVTIAALETHYDLKSDQYLIMQIQNQPFDFQSRLTEGEFTPAALRQQGSR